MSDALQWRDAVEALIVEGFHAVDHGQIAVAERRTTDDFEMILPNMTVTGEQYDQFVAKRAEAHYITRHCVTNVRTVGHGHDEITMSFVVTAHRLNAGADQPIVNVADMVDRWVLVADGWRHRSRSITPAFPVKLA
jgi:hypothetical protein